jgi:hypothetical protein
MKTLNPTNVRQREMRPGISCPVTKTMKSRIQNLIVTSLTLGLLLGGVTRSSADITLKVDSTKAWQGYMNVFNLPDFSGGYVFGSPWGIGDLNASFGGTSTLTLTPNTNTWNQNDAFWVNTNTVPWTGNKFMEANFYVENTALRGNTVTFSGTVLSNTLYGGASGHLARVFVKTLNSSAGYALVPEASVFLDLTNNASSYNFSITVAIPNLPNYIPQYGFVMTGPNVNPAWFATNGLVRIKVDNADPAITSAPVNQRTVVGGSASFTVAATGGSTLGYQWQRYSTNLLNSAGKFSGVTSPTLTIANAQLVDATSYSVVVTNAAGGATNSALLKVLTPAEFANLLDNPSFELGVVPGFPTTVPEPWNNFSGSALQSTNDYYFYNPAYPVQAKQGTNVVQVYNQGQYNGIYQEVPAAPGEIFTGDCWLWQSSQDPLYAPINEAFLEVQFWGAGGVPIAIYHSAYVTNFTAAAPAMMDTWLYLVATNGVASGYATTSTSNAKYLVAPPGANRVRYQVTLHAEGGGGGSVYVDEMRLFKKIPVTVTATLNGGNIRLAWATQALTDYQVVYKDNVNDAGWTPIGPVITGDGTEKTESFPTSNTKRFYSVLTL